MANRHPRLSERQPGIAGRQATRAADLDAAFAQPVEPAPELATVQEALAVAFGMLQMVTLSTDDVMAAQAGKAVTLVKRILSGDVPVLEPQPARELPSVRCWSRTRFLSRRTSADNVKKGTSRWKRSTRRIRHTMNSLLQKRNGL